MLAFLRYYLKQNLEQIDALGIEFDKTINVLTGGRYGQTVSLRAAEGAGYRADGQTGPREPGWCAFCAFLSAFVQRDHCALQFSSAPSSWVTWLRAGFCFAVGLIGIGFAADKVWLFGEANPLIAALLAVLIPEAIFVTTLFVEHYRKATTTMSVTAPTAAPVAAPAAPAAPNATLAYLVQRLGEPSTYAGLGMILGAAGVALPASYARDAVLLGMTIAGVASVVLKEGWRKALSSGDIANAIATATTTAATANVAPKG